MNPETPALPDPGVCVVDDEPAVRQALTLALQHFGFAVWQAVRLYRRHRDAIGVVLLDVRMPGLDGLQTLARLRRENPAVRVVFMTGNTGDYAAEELLGLGAAAVLEKPFRSLPELARLLRQVAEGGGGGQSLG
jgi:CheY-like chemotaxis protein